MRKYVRTVDDGYLWWWNGAMEVLIHCLRRLSGGMMAVCAITIFGAPSITQPPADVVVNNGQDATFRVAANGAGTLAYQWERDGFPISGATASSYVVNHAARAAMDGYDVVVSDATGSTRSTVARLWVSPIRFPGDIAPDATTDLQLETAQNATVNTMLPTDGGGYYIAGNFTSINGLRRTGIAHVTADRQVDTGFVPPAVRLTGTGIQSIAVQNGKIIVAGQFTTVAGLRRNALARLNGDGSFDPTFDASAVIDTTQTIEVVGIFPDGRIAVAPIGGGPQGLLVLLKPDGAYDTVLIKGGGIINAIAIQPDGKLVVVGEFTVIDQGTWWQNVIRFNADATVDHSFASTTTGHTPIGVAVAPDGSILIGGSMTSFDGTAVGGLVRLRSNGTLDTTFAPTVSGPPGNGTWQVHTVSVQQNGNVVFGGEFNAVNGTVRANLASVTPSGELTAFAVGGVPTFARIVGVLRNNTVVVGTDGVGTGSSALMHYSPGGGAIRLDFAFMARGGPSAVAALPSGKFLLAGSFDHAQGVAAPGIVRLNADGTLDSSFHATTVTGLAPNTVRAAVALPDGRVALGGTGIDGHRLGVVLLRTDGTEEPMFNPPSNLMGRVSCLALMPGKKLAVAEAELGIADPTAVAVFNLDGSQDTSFSSGSGFNGDLRSLLVQADGRIVVGGTFTSYRGAPCAYIARLNQDGSLDASFSANTHFAGAVTAMTFAPGGKLFANGGWLTADARYYRVVRLNADGSLDTSFVDAVASIPTGMLAQEDGKVIYRDNDRSVVRLNADGSVDSTFTSRGFDPQVTAALTTLLIRDDGQLLIVDGGGVLGTFYITNASGRPTLSSPLSQVVTPGAAVALTVTADGPAPISYQWYHDGVAIAGATTTSYTLSSFAPGEEGAYALTAKNGFGTTTSVATITAPPATGDRLINLSVRSLTGAESSSLIVGYVLGGSGTGGHKPLIVRGVGPTLTSFDVAGVLADPTLQLYDGASRLIDQNDDWAGGFDFTQVGAFPFTGPAPKDAAIYTTNAAAGPGSIIVGGKNGATGVALAEVYDATPADAFTVFTPRLINGSARTTVGLADKVLILGFVIGGRSSERILVRAVGPTLAQPPFNVGGTLADPVLEVYDSKNAKLATNDNWGDNGGATALSTAFASVGAFAFTSTNSKDAALVLTLAPGSYSALVRGNQGGTGVALVELYELP